MNEHHSLGPVVFAPQLLDVAAQHGRGLDVDGHRPQPRVLHDAQRPLENRPVTGQQHDLAFDAVSLAHVGPGKKRISASAAGNGRRDVASCRTTLSHSSGAALGTRTFCTKTWPSPRHKTASEPRNLRPWRARSSASANCPSRRRRSVSSRASISQRTASMSFVWSALN